MISKTIIINFSNYLNKAKKPETTETNNSDFFTEEFCKGMTTNFLFIDLLKQAKAKKHFKTCIFKKRFAEEHNGRLDDMTSSFKSVRI